MRTLRSMQQREAAISDANILNTELVRHTVRENVMMHEETILLNLSRRSSGEAGRLWDLPLVTAERGCDPETRLQLREKAEF